MRRISRHLGLSIGRFVRRYGRHVRETITYSGGIMLVSSIFLRVPRSGQCVFLQGDDCALQSVKPAVCARSPFVGYVAGDPRAWKRALAICPAIGRGARYSKRAISRLLEHERLEEEEDMRRLRRRGWSLGRALGAALPAPVQRALRLSSRDLQ